MNFNALSKLLKNDHQSLLSLEIVVTLLLFGLNVSFCSIANSFPRDLHLPTGPSTDLHFGIVSHNDKFACKCDFKTIVQRM